MKRIDWTIWRPRLLYGAFTVVAFFLSLRWTFPSEAVKERLIVEAGARGWQIEFDQLGAGGGVLGVSGEGVRLEDSTGLKLPLDKVTASLEVLPLLRGKRVLSFDARAWDGRLVGSTELSGEARRSIVKIDGLDLGQVLALKKASGLDLAGKLGGTADLVLPATGNNVTGRIDLAVAEAGVNGGQVPIPGMSAGLPLPRVPLGAVTAAVKLDQGKALVEKLESRGGEVELTGEGLQVVIQPKLEFAPVFGKARVKLQPAFWQKPQTQTLRSLAEMALAPSRTPDGSYAFQVYGSLGHPNFRPGQ